MTTNIFLPKKNHLKEKFQQKDAILNELKTLYWAEKQALKFLSRSEKAATTRYLKACFKGHLQATVQHINRLELVFELLNEKIRAKKCPVLENIIKDAISGIINTPKKTLLRELSLIGSAQKIEHYEINGYKKLIKFFTAIEQVKIAAFLEESLNEEKEADETYSAVKEDVFNDEIFLISNSKEFEAAEEE
ncbi:MAG: DUF892 family protein [Bacteroidia bacterium]